MRLPLCTREVLASNFGLDTVYLAEFEVFTAVVLKSIFF
jgi:hypothetical protein